MHTKRPVSIGYGALCISTCKAFAMPVCGGWAVSSTSLCLSKEKWQEKRHLRGEDSDFPCPGRKHSLLPALAAKVPPAPSLTRHALLRISLIETAKGGSKGLAPPGADAARHFDPQPRPWRAKPRPWRANATRGKRVTRSLLAVVKQAREGQCGKVDLRAPSWIPPGRSGEIPSSDDPVLHPCSAASGSEAFARTSARSAIELYQSCTMFDSRDDQPGHGTKVQRVSALFSLGSKNRFSFRARSKREMGLDSRRESSVNR